MFMESSQDFVLLINRFGGFKCSQYYKLTPVTTRPQTSHKNLAYKEI